MKTPKYIEVVRSTTKGLSSLSSESALAIVSSLTEQYDEVRLTLVNTADDLAELIDRKPDLVFLGVMHIPDSAEPSQNIWLSEQLERAGIAHTGSTRLSHELELHKDLAKQRVLDAGLATSPFHIIAIDKPYVRGPLNLQYPLFLKPLSGGGGQGVDEFSIVRTPAQLDAKISSLRTVNKVSVLIEQYLEGREFSVAVIQDPVSHKLIAMPLELIAPKDSNGERMLSRVVKTSNEERTIGLSDPRERELITTFALDVFRALGARDYGRIDIRLDGNGAPHFLEANLIPSLISGYGSFPKAYKLNEGVEYDEMISNIVLLGLSREPAAV